MDLEQVGIAQVKDEPNECSVGCGDDAAEEDVLDNLEEARACAKKPECPILLIEEVVKTEEDYVPGKKKYRSKPRKGRSNENASKSTSHEFPRRSRRTRASQRQRVFPENEEWEDREMKVKKESDSSRPCRSKGEFNPEEELLMRKERSRKTLERHRRRLATMTEDEKEVYREKQRLKNKKYYKSTKTLTKEEQERRREINKFRYVKKTIELGLLPEEEQKRVKMENYLKRAAYVANTPKEKLEAQRLRRNAKKRNLPAEVKAARREQLKQKLKNMGEEERKQLREYQTKACRKYMTKLKEENPEEHWKKTVGQALKRYHKTKEYYIQKTQSETPEQREARLLRYRINQAKRKLRKQLENEGVSGKEIEERLEQLSAEIKNKPRAPLQSAYKPRPSARKPHKMSERNKEFLAELEAKRIAGPVQELVHTFSLGKERSSTVLDIQGPYHLEPTQHQDENPPNLQTCKEPVSQLENQIMSSVQLSEKSHLEEMQVVKEAVVDDYSMADGDLNNSFDSPSPNPALQPECGAHDAKFDPTYSPMPHLLDSHSIPITGAVIQFDSLTSLTSIDPLPKLVLVTSESTFVSPSTKVFTKEIKTVCEEKSQRESSKNFHRKVPEGEWRKERKLRKVPAGGEICDSCGKVFKSLPNLHVHKELVHNPHCNTTKCPQCGVECPSTRSVWNHFLKHHMNEDCMTTDEIEVINLPSQKSRTSIKPTEPNQRNTTGSERTNQCEHCGKHFKQKCTLDDHVRRVHEGKSFFCDICTSGCDLQSAGKLWKHKVEKHGMADLSPPQDLEVLRCCYCKEILLRGYEAHVKKRHPERLPDFLSNEAIKKIPEKKLKQPKNREKEFTLVQCPHCSKDILRMSLVRHLRNIHGIGKRNIFECDDCGRHFKEKYRLKEHIRDAHTHNFEQIRRLTEEMKLMKYDSNPRKAECLVCNLQMEGNLHFTVKAHFVTEHHQIFEELKESSVMLSELECEDCQQKFRRKLDLRNHMITDHPEKSWTCDECNVFKKTQWELENHRKSHQNEPSGPCAKCSEDIPDPLILQNHVKDSHPGSFWACSYCPMWKYSESELKSHVRQCHKLSVLKLRAKEIEKMSIFCEHCDLILKVETLTKHMESKHDIKPENMACEHCPRKFKSRSYWLGHLEAVHGVQLDKILRVAGEEARKEQTEKSKSDRHVRTQPKCSSNDDGDKAQTKRKRRSQTMKARTRRRGKDLYETTMNIEKMQRLVISVIRLSQNEINSHLRT